MKRAILGLLIMECMWMTGLLHAQEEPTDQAFDALQGQKTTTEKVRGVSSEIIQRLKRLKEENPEAFRQEIQERRRRLDEKLSFLKTHDPASYEKAMTTLKGRRASWLRHLREREPERFREWVSTRRAHIETRLETLRQNDPNRYERLMQRHLQSKERRQKHSRGIREDAKDRVEDAIDRQEDRRDRREDRRDYREGIPHRDSDNGFRNTQSRRKSGSARGGGYRRNSGWGR